MTITIDMKALQQEGLRVVNQAHSKRLPTIWLEFCLLWLWFPKNGGISYFEESEQKSPPLVWGVYGEKTGFGVAILGM